MKYLNSKNVALLVSISLLCFSLSLLAESMGPVPLSGTELHILESINTGHKYRVEVAMPIDPAYPNGEYPVVYVTDGAMSFPALYGMTRWLSIGNELPPFILVAISYETLNPLDTFFLRGVDLTPTIDIETVEEMRQQPPPFNLPKNIELGGGPAFLKFIEEELKPLIDENYPTNPNNETYAGHSLGGLFGLYVLFNSTDSFENYIITSPSIWWDNQVSLEYEKTFSENNRNLNKKVFIAVGSLENAGMNDDAKEMYDKLSQRDYPGLSLDYYLFDGETHNSVGGPSIMRGLKYVLGGP